MKYQMEPAATAITPTAPIATRILFMRLSGSRSLEIEAHGPRGTRHTRDAVSFIGSRKRDFHQFERAGNRGVPRWRSLRMADRGAAATLRRALRGLADRADRACDTACCGPRRAS